MTNRHSACPAWLINVYGAALYLYPKSFREKYREQILQAFSDNYQRRKDSNSILFYLNTINDLGNSMSQEHFSSFSQHGRIRMAFVGLFLVLGLLVLRPFLVNSLTDGMSSLAKTDDKISERVFQDYFRHNEKIAVDLLHSDDPMKVMAGANFLSEWQSDSFFGVVRTQKIDLNKPVNDALDRAGNNAAVWIAAYPICLKYVSTCDAEKTLNQLRIIAPENGMTWLYSALEARENGDIETQAIYLRKALDASFFDDANNALNARWYYAHAENTYRLPWYSGYASGNLAKLETSVMGFDNYSIPGCKDADKANVSIQKSCLEIASKIALQPTSSLSLKLGATTLATKLGDQDSIAKLELLKEQNSGYAYYLYATDKKDIAALAAAYEKERQYDFATQMAAANRQNKYPDIYEF